MNFKLNFKKTAFFFLFFSLFLPLISFAVPDPEAFVYTPMEEIPGFSKPSSYGEYIGAIYNFGIWTIGISAVLMISIGAFMYIGSAGNTSTAGKAKGIITDAITGVILAMISYVLIYTINPSLLQIRTPGLISGGISGGSGALKLGTDGSGTTAKGYVAACPNPNSTTGIDFSGATSDANIQPNSTCNIYDSKFQSYGSANGVDWKLLKAIAQIESSCGSNKGPSPYGACGLMQILPSTAGKTCQELIDNDDLSIELAAKFIKTSLASSCVAATGADATSKNSAILAGYNSGYGCSGGACSPQKHALCASNDCPGKLAFQCCKNPGGLGESISYAWNGIGLMSKL